MCSLLAFLSLSLPLQKWMNKVNMAIPTIYISRHCDCFRNVHVAVSTQWDSFEKLYYNDWKREPSFTEWLRRLDLCMVILSPRGKVCLDYVSPEDTQAERRTVWARMMLLSPWTQHYIRQFLGAISEPGNFHFPFFVKLAWSGFLSHLTKKSITENRLQL